MATTTSLEITMTKASDNTTEKNRTVSYINPEAEAADLVDFAEAYVGLTNDNYLKTTRIDKTDCDTAPTRTNYPITRMDWIDNSSGSTATPQFTVENPVINAKTNSFSSKQLQIRVQVPYIGAPIALSSSANWVNLKMQYGFVSASSLPTNTWVISFYTTQETIATENFNVTLHFDGNAQYKSFDLTIAVNITEAGE